MPFLLLLVFRGIHPLELSHFLFIGLNASRRELDHPEEKVDVVYVALSEGFDGHVLEEVGHPYDSNELVPHHGPIAIIHVLWETESVFLLGVFFLDLVLKSRQNHTDSFLGFFMHFFGEGVEGS